MERSCIVCPYLTLCHWIFQITLHILVHWPKNYNMFGSKFYVKQHSQKTCISRFLNFIEFKDSSVDAIVLNLAASEYYHDFRPYYFCSYFLSCPLKFPITHFLKQLISIPEWIQTSFIKVSPTLDQISVFAWNLVPCYQHKCRPCTFI